MSNNQPPPDLLLLDLAPKQLAILREVLAQECSKKLEIRYADLDKDQENVRRSIYLDGGVDMLKYLLRFDQDQLEAAEQAKQELLGNQPSDVSDASSF